MLLMSPVSLSPYFLMLLIPPVSLFPYFLFISELVCSCKDAAGTALEYMSTLKKRDSGKCVLEHG